MGKADAFKGRRTLGKSGDRTAFLLDQKADRLRVWYGGKKKLDASWGIGYTEGRYSQILAALAQ